MSLNGLFVDLGGVDTEASSESDIAAASPSAKVATELRDLVAAGIMNLCLVGVEKGLDAFNANESTASRR